MSTAEVRAKIRELLSTPTPEVLAINGRWGVGKTFFWTRLIEEFAKENALALPKYAYVSCFGISTMEQLKSSLFEQTIERNSIRDGVSVKTVRDNLRAFFSLWRDDPDNIGSRLTNLGRSVARKSTAIVGSVPQVQGYAALVRSGAFMLVRETLICIAEGSLINQVRLRRYKLDQ